MEKILFPTDFSEHSPQLLKYALELAKAFKATLFVIHVYGSEEDAKTPRKETEDMADYMMDVLTDFTAKNKGDNYAGVPIRHVVDVGLPGTEIVDIALEEDIELIVMGMTGKNNVKEKLFGSTALEVIRKADCPVLAIPSFLEYKNPQNLVYMTDFLFRDIGVMNFLNQWVKALGIKIHCLHVVERNQNEMDALVNMSMLKDAFKSSGNSKFEVLKGNLVEKTIQYLNGNNIGIVAMLSRKRDIFHQLLEGSKTRKVVKKIERPILVFKENAYKPISFPVDFSKFSIA